MKLELLNKLNLKAITKEKGIKPLIIFLVCCAMALIMSSNDITNSKKTIQDVNTDEKSIYANSDKKYREELEKSLKNMIIKVRGIDDATVMLTLKSSTEKVVLKDIPYTKEETKEEQSYSSEEETVLIEGTNGEAKPYIVKKINPEVEGVVVGIKTKGESLEKEIIDIVQALFDIPIHKIKIVNIN